jgi:hypothetical protein
MEKATDSARVGPNPPQKPVDTGAVRREEPKAAGAADGAELAKRRIRAGAYAVSGGKAARLVFVFPPMREKRF